MNFYNKIIIVSALVLTSLTTVTTVLSTRAEAQTVKRVQTRQLSIVLKRVNKDSSRVYTVNNQEVIVTKARLDEVAKIVKDNNIKAPVNSDIKLGSPSFLKAFIASVGSISAGIAFRLKYYYWDVFWTSSKNFGRCVDFVLKWFSYAYTLHQANNEFRKI